MVIVILAVLRLRGARCEGSGIGDAAGVWFEGGLRCSGVASAFAFGLPPRATLNESASFRVTSAEWAAESTACLGTMASNWALI